MMSHKSLNRPPIFVLKKLPSSFSSLLNGVHFKFRSHRMKLSESYDH